MLVSDYNYNLPEERIAKYPPEMRGSTRLLVLDRQTGALADSFYRDLAQYLDPGDVLVLNDTKVMPSRLWAALPDGRERELVVLEKHGDEPQRVMYRGKLHDGDVLTVITNKAPAAAATVGAATPTVSPTGAPTPMAPATDSSTPLSVPTIHIEHILGGGIAEVSSEISLADLAERYGTVPLPPYLHRDADTRDQKRYQTVWAREVGSAAAPTASLNMTDDLLAKLRAKGVIIEYLTLHVGLGTFLPIRTDVVEEHHMHSEWYHIPRRTLDAISAAKAAHHRVIAVGTTVTRTLEYYAKTGQPEGEDDIFIYPGYEFQLVDALVTNFHAPRSTVLMLAAAFAGWPHLHRAYDYAVQHDYNFLSYGDSMFIC